MKQLAAHDVDLIVLDIMLPDTDGLTLCRCIKEQYGTPILFLSALGESGQIIEGLRAEGDDYLPKLYDIGVLLARIDARLRAARGDKHFVCFGSPRLDTVSMIAFVNDADLLLSLAESVNRLVSKEALYREVWGANPGESHTVIYTTVSRLNKKLDDAAAGLRVVLHRGEGYALEQV